MGLIQEVHFNLELCNVDELSGYSFFSQMWNFCNSHREIMLVFAQKTGESSMQFQIMRVVENMQEFILRVLALI